MRVYRPTRSSSRAPPLPALTAVEDDAALALPPVQPRVAVALPAAQAAAVPPGVEPPATPQDAEADAEDEVVYRMTLPVGPLKRLTGEIDMVVSTKKVHDGRTKVYWRGREYTRASISFVKIVYRCSFWRRDCPAKLVFLASIMEYDYDNATEHTCTPLAHSGERADPAPHDVTAPMKAEVQRLTDWFPDAHTIGCLFHFKQACGRRLIKYRMPPAEIKIAMEFGVFDMLTVIEVEKIPKQGVRWVRAKIRERCEEDGVSYSTKKWNAFWKYFRRTWLLLFPPKLWNVRDYAPSMVARTNNPLERFNRELNAAFATPHPSLPRFVHTIEEIARKAIDQRNDVTNGRAKAPRRQERITIPQAVQLGDSDDESEPEDEEEEVAEDEAESGDDGADLEEDLYGFDEDDEDERNPDDVEDIVDDEDYVHSVVL